MQIRNLSLVSHGLMHKLMRNGSVAACRLKHNGNVQHEAQKDEHIHGGTTHPKHDNHANFARRYNHPTPVGDFPKGRSPEGITDLAGNVWEWCLDEYDLTYYQQNKKRVQRNPLNLRFRDILRTRVIRGGAWGRW